MSLLNSAIGRFRIIAFMEGISFLIILFVTMPLKYIFNMPEPNKVIGMAHGVLFIAYIAVALLLHFRFKWKISFTLKVLAASIIPFGTFYIERKLFRDC